MFDCNTNETVMCLCVSAYSSMGLSSSGSSLFQITDHKHNTLQVCVPVAVLYRTCQVLASPGSFPPSGRYHRCSPHAESFPTEKCHRWSAPLSSAGRKQRRHLHSNELQFASDMPLEIAYQERHVYLIQFGGWDVLESFAGLIEQNILSAHLGFEKLLQETQTTTCV